ncbi:MerR family transcriptional regulator [Streptomyces kaniharaensis]|uniref:MerR family transcriptional regulator n=1 Tax=Streptomyces kaniharaensis TaxID=212423 RepID=A0A6N7KRD3_9ACTN|nr:MerR family transcriptional regulator [Streptomyces kaniharaensis]
MWSIGELAEHAGVTVKTVRFYSDRGLLPEAGRSSGGHRRYGPEALDRLRLIRSLRTLDLPVPEVGRLLEQDEVLGGALEDAVARQLRELGSQLTALRWREAALRLLHDCPPEERADRLTLIGGLATPPDTTVLARFWRRALPPRMPAGLTAAILDAAVPQPPTDPAPDKVLAFARLHALASGGCSGASHSPTGKTACPNELARTDAEYRPAVLYQGLAEAYDLAGAELRAGRDPRDGEALDSFVAAHAASRSTRDTPAFRRRLRVMLTVTDDPVIARYWELAGELTDAPTLGSAHEWLRTALDGQLAAAA